MSMVSATVDATMLANFTALSANNPKQVAVVQAVNAVMDISRPGWNANAQGDTRKMDTDYQYSTNSMPAFLGLVQQRLAARHYTLKITVALVRACVPAMLFQLKYFVYQKTT